jgi:hypothetical protein
MTQPSIFLSNNPKDPLPDADGDILLFRTNGDRLIRCGGKWRRISEAAAGGSMSVRASLPAKNWKRVNFPGTYSLVPNYSVRCYGLDDPNRVIESYKFRSISNTGFEIYAPEACVMELNIFNINTETVL